MQFNHFPILSLEYNFLLPRQGSQEADHQNFSDFITKTPIQMYRKFHLQKLEIFG